MLFASSWLIVAGRCWWVASAVIAFGYQRLTVDVDVLIRRDDLARFKEQWLGRGYVEVRPGGKAVRDTANNVRIDFLLAGDFPGDGKPKPVAFPEPAMAVASGASSERGVGVATGDRLGSR